MGYADIHAKRQHEKDAAKIAALEAELRKAKADKTSEPPKADDGAKEAPQQVIVEKTSKKLKAQIVFSWLAIAFGFCCGFGGWDVLGAIMIGAGVLVLVFTKAAIWWQHG